MKITSGKRGEFLTERAFLALKRLQLAKQHLRHFARITCPDTSNMAQLAIFINAER
ncbi:hypothetical protein D3C78_1037420 [compost metagenome]